MQETIQIRPLSIAQFVLKFLRVDFPVGEQPENSLRGSRRPGFSIDRELFDEALSHEVVNHHKVPLINIRGSSITFFTKGSPVFLRCANSFRRISV